MRIGMVSTLTAAIAASFAAPCWLTLASRRDAPSASARGRAARAAPLLLQLGGYGFLIFALLCWSAATGWETGIPFFLALSMIAGAVCVLLKANHPRLLQAVGALTAVSALAAGSVANFAGI